MKIEAHKLHCTGFLLFLPNVVKIDPYNFELYCFKVGAFWRHSVEQHETSDSLLMIVRSSMPFDIDNIGPYNFLL